MKAYCLGCKKKQKMKQLQYVEGDVEIKYKCSVCGAINIAFVEDE